MQPRWGSSARQRLRLLPLYAAVVAADALGRMVRPPRALVPSPWTPGVSILIPERDAPAMLADALEFIQRASWVVTWPGLAILITVLAFNLMGDGLRDALDPKLKR